MLHSRKEMTKQTSKPCFVYFERFDLKANASRQAPEVSIGKIIQVAVLAQVTDTHRLTDQARIEVIEFRALARLPLYRTDNRTLGKQQVRPRQFSSHA